MNKYKIYCQTDGWVEVIASAEPTQCPIDNAHTVITGSAAVVKTGIDSFDGVATELTLDEYKQIKFKEIDRRTAELIAEGFTYNSKVFSLSNNAQINLLGVDIKRNDGILPLTFNTIDDLDDITFTTAADVDSFFMVALATKKTHLESGNSLKVSIRNATTEAEVDAVVDTR
jgi:hypothetical protein